MIIPVLQYDDAPAALRWLADAFGLEQVAAYENPDGTIAHAEMRLGDGYVMLASSRADRPASRGASVYVVADDPDERCARARAAGAEIIREPADMDYGSREFGARDPEGNEWSFGTYRPHGG